jgi:hypothetical protein
VARDQRGRDTQYELMMRWCDEQFGPARWFHVEERLSTLPDTLQFYFVATADAQVFVDRFSCGVWIKGKWPHGGTARADEGDMRWVGICTGRCRPSFARRCLARPAAADNIVALMARGSILVRRAEPLQQMRRPSIHTGGLTR